MPAFDQELFGPVAAIIETKDDRQAIELANKTTYGLERRYLPNLLLN